MKLEFLALSALVPIRIITLTGPIPHLPPSEVTHSPHIGENEHHDMRFSHPHPHPPCHGKGSLKGPRGALADLLTRLGFVRPHGPHGDGQNQHHADSAINHHGHGHVDDKHEENEWKVIKAWKHHVEEVGNRVLPIVEGGAVKILPFTEEDKVKMEEHGHGHGHGHGYKHDYAIAHPHGHGHGHGHHLRPHGGHRWHQSSFGSRLHRAISSLTPTEATALAFVLGAGIGSIMHLIFMLFLITIRRMRGLKYRSKEERRQARRARRAARADKKEGGVKLAEDEVVGEVLPGYGEGEGDRLVEKA